MNYPKIGNLAPKFSLLNQEGQKVNLNDFLGQYVVVYFYPRALTPGCTVQACDLRDRKKDLTKLDTVILGISPDPIKKLKNFEEKKELNFTLLSDEDHKTADKYGVWGPKKFMGKEYNGIHRVTFIIDHKGKLIHIMDGFKTKNHAEELIEVLKELQG